MDADKLKELLQEVAQGELTSSQAYELLKSLTFDDIGFAKLDQHRLSRQGMAEVIYCPGKTASQIVAIIHRMKPHHDVVLATRADGDTANQVLSLIPDGHYDQTARMLIFGTMPQADDEVRVCVVSAGTADMPVAEECALYLVACGIRVERVYDVGVAGIHRLFPYVDILKQSQAVIVVAGMDGALPSVIGGLVGTPVIAVPTSTGYGASFHGLAALLTMLNSCAAGLTVVNIDNGFGAAVAAQRIVAVVKAKRQISESKGRNE
jgi:pyridinium-3,5-biscarboxylic acid mononucleotide synthase